jgi:hypothetical protein
MEREGLGLCNRKEGLDQNQGFFDMDLGDENTSFGPWQVPVGIIFYVRCIQV